MHQEAITLSSQSREELVDVTEELRALAKRHPEATLMALFAKGATSAGMIQENWDPNIRTDILDCLRGLIPKGKWLHDKVDGNADAHIKAGIVGPSETIPLDSGELLLGTWQNVFFCDFDGPRSNRKLIVTLI
jgi:secondary thiamine-phosphate synthase enzyme